MSLVWALLLIGLLVTVHELGHFAVARLLDVQVLRLSIGFGPRLFTLRRGGTEYTLAAIPLGGYVKMLGEDPDDEVAPSERRRSFGHRPTWQRLAIVLAGPAANLVFPVLIYFHFFVGEQYALSPTVGVVFEGQPADGVLAPGDRILAIDDQPVRYWDDVTEKVGGAAGRELRITVERPGESAPLSKIVTPRAHLRRDLLGAPDLVGQIGVMPHYRLAQIGVTAGGPAARAGLRTFDVVTSVQGKPIADWRELAAALSSSRGEALLVTYLRPPDRAPLGFAALDRLSPGTAQLFPERIAAGARARYETGIRSGELFVHDVERGSPAERAGIAAGDQLLTVDGAPLDHWELLEQAFEDRPERPFRLAWRTAAGADREAAITLAPRRPRDELEGDERPWLFGAQPARATRPVPLTPIEGRIGWAARRAVSLTAQITGTTARVLALLITGKLPASAIGGPIMILHLAGAAASHGADQFLAMVALISLNLGLLNLLPVPVLDGGHVLFIGIEAVRRRPLGPRLRRNAYWVGLALLAALMLLAARNDVVRYWLS